MTSDHSKSATDNVLQSELNTCLGQLGNRNSRADALLSNFFCAGVVALADMLTKHNVKMPPEAVRDIADLALNILIMRDESTRNDLN